MNRPATTRPAALQLLHLEPRDVPATFYVDPALAGRTDGSTQTFNAGQSNQVAGLVYGASAATPNAQVFSSLAAALAAAEPNLEADTVFLADGNIPVDGAGGTISVNNDRITLTGSGRTRTTLRPAADTFDATFGSIEFLSGSSLTASAFTYDGSGRQIGSAFYFDSSSGAFNGVTIQNTVSGTATGVGIVATFFSTLDVANSTVAGYGRIGVSYSDSTGAVTNSTFAGLGAVATPTVNYGLQITDNSTVTVTGSTFTGNQANAPDGSGGFDRSAGIVLFAFDNSGTPAPTATITGNTFASNYHGVQVGSNPGIDRSTATLRTNTFATSNTVAVQAENVTTVDARKNFFSARNGPFQATTNPNGMGAAVSAGVTFNDWLSFAPGTVGELQPGYAVAPGGGASPAYLGNGAGSLITAAAAFGGAFQGEVRVASGDLNGDGRLDVIVGAGVGGSSHVQAFDGATGGLLYSFFAYQPGFTGGVFVGAGDVTGDGRADIITGAGAGGAPHVKVYDGATGAVVRSFFAYATGFAGGVTVAGGDVNNDGQADVITGTGVGGAPHVRVFSGRNGAELQSFFAYDSRFTGGVFVGAGDLNGDGRADVITGTGTGGGAHVRAWSSNVDGSRGGLVANFILENNLAFTGGVRVAAHDLDDDGKDDLILGYGRGGDSRVRTLNANSLSTPAAIQFNIPGNVYTGTNGLFVG